MDKPGNSKTRDKKPVEAYINFKYKMSELLNKDRQATLNNDYEDIIGDRKASYLKTNEDSSPNNFSSLKVDKAVMKKITKDYKLLRKNDYEVAGCQVNSGKNIDMNSFNSRRATLSRVYGRRSEKSDITNQYKNECEEGKYDGIEGSKMPVDPYYMNIIIVNNNNNNNPNTNSNNINQGGNSYR